MPLSCPTQSGLTDSELALTFGTNTTPGILPSTPTPSTDREGNGMIKNDVVKRIVGNLKQTGVIPIPKPSEEEAYIAKRTKFMDNIKNEYCFYDSRYKYSLEKVFAAIRTAQITPTADNKSTVTRYLEFAKTLNLRLNDLTQIINEISNELLQSSNNLEAEVAQFNKMIQDQKANLEEQNKIISSNEAATKIGKQMVKYTEEKGRYSDNLLKLYSFLNIVTLGLLFYVYRASANE